jgi:hypothetical protein
MAILSPDCYTKYAYYFVVDSVDLTQHTKYKVHPVREWSVLPAETCQKIVAGRPRHM